MIGSASTNKSSTLSIIIQGVGVKISSSLALSTPNAISITNEHISKVKIRYIELRECINKIILLYENTLKTLTID